MKVRFNRRDVSTFLLCMITSFPIGWVLRQIGIVDGLPRMVLHVALIMLVVFLVKLAFRLAGLGAVVGWEKPRDR